MKHIIIKLFFKSMFLCCFGVCFNGFAVSAASIENNRDNYITECKHVFADLELDQSCFPKRSMISYRDYYGLNIPGARHCYGTFKSMEYNIVWQVFSPTNPKATVFLLHGYLDHSGTLKKMIHFLVNNRYAVAVYDMPGHGLSSGDRSSINNFREYTVVLKEFTDLYTKKFQGSVHLIAHSTGAAAGMGYILAGDNKFEKIIFIAPLIRSAKWYVTQTFTFIINPFIDRLPRITRENSADLQFIKFVKNDPLQNRSLTLKWVKSLFLWNKMIENSGGSLKNIVVIQGDIDKTVDWKYNTGFIKKKFPNSEIIMIKNGRHHLLNESLYLRSIVFDKILSVLEMAEAK